MPNPFGTWSAIRLGCHRSLHSATRLADGRVLLAGGRRRSTAETDGVCRIDEPRSHDSVEILDPESAASEPAASLLQPREAHEAVRLGDGSVAIVGGLGDYG